MHVMHHVTGDNHVQTLGSTHNCSFLFDHSMIVHYFVQCTQMAYLTK